MQKKEMINRQAVFTQDKLNTHVAAQEPYNEKHKSRKQRGGKGNTKGGKKREKK